MHPSNSDLVAVEAEPVAAIAAAAVAQLIIAVAAAAVSQRLALSGLFTR